MTVTSLFPILATRDLPRIVSFYEQVLGATIDYRFPSPEGEGDAYVSLRFGAAGALGVGSDPDAAPEVPHDRIALWFYVDDVDAAFAAALRAEVSEERAPTDMPWGERVAQVRDPDGNLINLAAPPH